MAFGLFGLSAMGGGLMDQLSQNDIDAMNKLKLQDEQSTLEAQKFSGQILQNNPEIAARVLGGGDLGGLGGLGVGGLGGVGGGLGGVQPTYQPPPQAPQRTPMPGQPSQPMQPPPQQAASPVPPGGGSNLTGPNTMSYVTPQPNNPDPRIRGLQMIAAGQGAAIPGMSPLAAVPQNAYEQLRDQQHQPWLGPNNAPVGPAANAPRPAQPPGVDPNAPQPMPPQARQQQPQPPPQQQPQQQQAGGYGGQFPQRGLDLRDAIARMQAKQPNMKPEVMFKTLMLLQKALNPESRLQLQYMNTLLAAQRVQQGQERIGLAGDRKTDEKQEVGQIADAIQSGEQSPDLKGLYRLQGPLRAELANRGVSLAKMQMEWNAAQKQIGSLNSQRMIQYTGLARSVVNTIDRVNELADQMKNSGIPLLNRAKLTALVQTQGNTPAGQLAAQYLTSVNTLKEEFANLANGGYAPTEPAWKLADQQVNANFGMDQLHATLGEVRRLIGFRLQNIPNLDTLGGFGANRYTGQSGTSVVPSAPGGGGGGDVGGAGGSGNVIRYDRDGNRIQ